VLIFFFVFILKIINKIIYIFRLFGVVIIHVRSTCLFFLVVFLITIWIINYLDKIKDKNKFSIISLN
jgi:hypothetical protein